MPDSAGRNVPFLTDLCSNFEPKKGQVILLSDIEHEELKKFIDTQLAKGYIYPSISEQTSPVFFIPKKDGGKRLIQDYRYLNSGMVKNNYPLPLINDLVHQVRGCDLFTKMDL